MDRSYRYLHLDVFTDRIFGGNQLAVFLDARGLSTSTMQAIAKEMNFSESTFVLPPERGDKDARVRIFTPEAELPMAGHPTIGTTFALARAGIITPDRQSMALGLGIGPTEIALTWLDEVLSFAWMTQLKPTFGDPLSDRAGAALTLRLPPSAVTDTGLPVQCVSCGLPFLLVPLATRHAVDEATLDLQAYRAFCRSEASEELPVLLFTTDQGGDVATAYTRMFAPTFGVAEDAATGSASGPLGCYLVRHGIVRSEKADTILSRQGVRMGRPSSIHIAIGVSGGDIDTVRVGGQAVVAGEGVLYV